jgi:hypothetical protein
MTGPTAYSVVIPTIGRPCLADCLHALVSAGEHPPEEVVVVDDRREPTGPLPLEAAGGLPVRTMSTGGRGPAAARNAGWSTPTGNTPTRSTPNGETHAGNTHIGETPTESTPARSTPAGGAP